MSRLRLLAGPRIGFHPLDLGRTSLPAWWCADDWTNAALMTNDGAGLISSCKDRVGRIDLTAVTTARPTAAASSFNGTKAGLTLDGVANTLNLLGVPATLPTGAAEGLILLVADPGPASAAEVLFNYGNSTAAQNRQINRTAASLLRASDGAATLSVADTVATVTPCLVVATFASAGVSFWKNGTLVGTSGAGTLNTNTTRIRMGASLATTPVSFFSGVIRHAMVLARTLSTLQRQRLEGWCAWDAGLTALLPSSHPYKSTRP